MNIIFIYLHTHYLLSFQCDYSSIFNDFFIISACFNAVIHLIYAKKIYFCSCDYYINAKVFLLETDSYKVVNSFFYIQS